MTATTSTPRTRARGFAHESTHNESIEWYAPPEVFHALGLTFDVDPASPGEGKSFVPSRRHITAEEDGLAADWGSGIAWVNPPYGPHTATWLAKLADHGNGIALVFARTDNKWFHETVARADLICFVSGRVKFYKGSTDLRGDSPGAGSMLVAYGPEAAAAVAASGLGTCVRVDRSAAA